MFFLVTLRTVHNNKLWLMFSVEVVGEGVGELVFYTEPATTAISWQGSHPCKLMPHAESFLLAEILPLI